MTTALIVLSLLAQSKPVDKYTLDFFQGSFVIRHGEAVERVPLKLDPEKPKLASVFRRDHNYAVWDERGLTVRIGTKVTSTHLPEIAVSPKIFRRSEILRTLDLAAKGQRSKDAAALSGAIRLGNEVYFLPRWEDKGGKTWMEALVRVDLSSPKPRWQLVGSFQGTSTASKAIDDVLFFQGGKLCVAARAEDGWGISTYTPSEDTFGFEHLGDDLRTWHSGGLFVEATNYGTTLAGHIVGSGLARETLLESKGNARFIDGNKPLLAIVQTPSGPALRNVDTAAELPLPASCAVRRAKKLIVVWAPYDKPKVARVYRAGRWQELARWQAPTK